MEKVLSSLVDLDTFAKEIVHSLSPRESGATLVTLSGELGAGKTAFAKAVAKTLGVKEVVTSPTFVLEKIYPLAAPRSGAGFTHLVHIDAYRLNSGADLAPLAFGAITQEPGNLILLEWPEKVADALPPPSLALTLSVREDGTRYSTYTYGT